MSESFWWCPNCKREVGGTHVTFEENHESCGTRVWSVVDHSVADLIENQMKELDSQETEITRLKNTLGDADTELFFAKKINRRYETEIIRLQRELKIANEISSGRGREIDLIGTLLTDLVGCACVFHDSATNLDVNDLLIAKDCINRVKGRANG
jgi:hypothetical protein